MTENFLPLLLFVIAATFTPGPNNIMVMASAANFGVRATAPHMSGVVLGFTFMVVAVGLGLGVVFVQYPTFHQVMKYLGALYLFWFAWKVATATGAKQESRRAKPLTFLQAAGFQWVNPKAWMMSVSAFAAYAAGGGVSPLAQALFFGAVFGGCAVPSVGVWALFGSAIGRLLKSNRALRIFNGAMGGLLAASVVLLFV